MRPSRLLAGGLILSGIALTGVGLIHWPFPRTDASITRTASTEVRFITAQDLKRRLDQGERLQVADIRRRQAFESLHLKGAISLPMETHASWGPLLDKAQTLVFYWTWESEASSARAALEIQKTYGHPDILVLEGGLGAWVDAGYPHVKRALPASLKRVNGN